MNFVINPWGVQCTIGWSDFERKKYYTFYVVPNCCWNPNPKCHVLMLPLSLVAGPQKIRTVTQKSVKKNLFKHFWSLRQGGTHYLIFLKYTWSAEICRFSKIEKKVLNHSTPVYNVTLLLKLAILINWWKSQKCFSNK